MVKRRKRRLELKCGGREFEKSPFISSQQIKNQKF
jgi:hypothetical protein